MPTYVLGLSAFYHDSAACLLRDGTVIAAAQEERFSRLKGDAGFPARAVDACLERAGITLSDVALVVFHERPLLKLDRVLESFLSIAPRGLRSFLHAAPLWLGERVQTERLLREGLGGYAGSLLFAEHHESHAASAFLPSPFERAAVLTVDGVGEWATATLGVGDGASLRLTRELRYPDSLGLLYSAFTHHVGFEVNGGEYKLMGLAPLGEPTYVARILDEVMSLREDGSFTLDQRYFDYLGGLTMTSDLFSERFGGPARAPGSALTTREMDLACSMQVVCEEVMLRMAREAHREFGGDALCLAGGVALNAVANGRLLREGPFRRLWIQPASGDAGAALGAALLGWHRWLGGERHRTAHSADAMCGARLGPEFAAADVEAVLSRLGACVEQLDEVTLLERTADMLAEGQVVAWFDGAMEFGPRALGGRSILADPRDASMQQRLNLLVKRRESFRPFAPSVLAERASEWFAMGESDAYAYMLLVAPLRPERDGAIPAVTHRDGSARVQTVDKERSPRFHALLCAFEQRTGCPILLNTSFNVRDEPIVATPADAYACFMGTSIDALVMPPFLVRRAQQSASPRLPERGQVPSIDRPRGRRFGLEIGIASVLLGGWLMARGTGRSGAWMAAGGAVLCLLALSTPHLLEQPARGWHAAGTALTRIVSPVVLRAVYFLVLSPVALLRRLTGSPMHRDPDSPSWWSPRAETTPDEQRSAMGHQS